MSRVYKPRLVIELDKDDEVAITRLQEEEKLTRSDIVRRLIRKANREMSKKAARDA